MLNLIVYKEGTGHLHWHLASTAHKEQDRGRSNPQTLWWEVLKTFIQLWKVWGCNATSLSHKWIFLPFILEQLWKRHTRLLRPWIFIKRTRNSLYHREELKAPSKSMSCQNFDEWKWKYACMEAVTKLVTENRSVGRISRISYSVYHQNHTP